MSLLLLFGNQGEEAVAVQYPVRMADRSALRYGTERFEEARYGVRDISAPRYTLEVTDG